MAKSNSGYLGLGYVPSLILAIIPFTSWILGAIVALQNKSYLWFVIRIVFGWNIVWIIDLVSMIVNRKLKWLV